MNLMRKYFVTLPPKHFIMKFKTNAKCGGCVAAIGMALKGIIPAAGFQISRID